LVRKVIAVSVSVIMVLLFTSCEDNASDDETTQEAGVTSETHPQPGFSLPYSDEVFTATDIFGNIVTQDMVGEKDVYFIHLWATWCSPCVNGMPSLAELSREYSDRVGFIGLLNDYDSNLEGAVNIVENADAPASFVMIDANEESVAVLLDEVSTGYLPASMVLTSDGFFKFEKEEGDYEDFIKTFLN
jgi:thiol-disulfide isomerase/thioredoxin